MKTEKKMHFALMGMGLAAVAGTASAQKTVVSDELRTVVYEVINGRQHLLVLTRYESMTVGKLWTKIERIRMNQDNTAPEVHEEITEYVDKDDESVQKQADSVAAGGYGGGSGWVGGGSTTFLGASGCYGSCGSSGAR